MNGYEKAFVFTVAGCCGVAGFILSFVALGWILEPVQEWIDSK